MTINDILYIGYKRYKDQDIEERNGYSLSFEDLHELDCDDDDDDDSYVDADICDLSDDWTPLGKIQKKFKKTFAERMIRYIIWCIVLSGMMFLCYQTLIKLYRE
jgi:hypothetical protein